MCCLSAGVFNSKAYLADLVDEVVNLCNLRRAVLLFSFIADGGASSSVLPSGLVLGVSGSRGKVLGRAAAGGCWRGWRYTRYCLRLT